MLAEDYPDLLKNLVDSFRGASMEGKDKVVRIARIYSARRIGERLHGEINWSGHRLESIGLVGEDVLLALSGMVRPCLRIISSSIWRADVFFGAFPDQRE